MLHVDSNPAPSNSLREANCESRRRRILESARRLISSGGMQAVTMRAVAADADLSVTTLYNLIGGRETIIKALLDDAIDRMDDVLARESPLDDPLERCRAVITVSIDYVARNADIFRPFALSVSHHVAASDHESDDETDDGGRKEDAAKRSISNRASHMQGLAIQAAIDQGLLTDLLDAERLGSQVYQGWEAAFSEWGRGLLDESTFRARTLYGLYVALLGVASESIRPSFESELQELERELDSNRNLTN